MGFPGGSAVKNPSGNAGDVGSIPGWEDPLEKEMATHSSILARKIPWTERTWQTTVHGVTKETDDLAGFCLFNLFVYFNWRLTTLQYCSGFCHTFT